MGAERPAHDVDILHLAQPLEPVALRLVPNLAEWRSK